MDDYVKFMQDSSGVLWWKKDSPEKIVFLNPIPPLLSGSGIDIQQLLHNLVWAQQTVEEEDFFRFKMFIKSMREGQPALVISRLKNKQGGLFWWKIAGAPGFHNPNDYFGFIQDITENVTFINHLLEKDLARQTMIETYDHPVLLVDMESNAIISRNLQAFQLFGYSFQEFNRMKFQDLYPASQAPKAAKIYETCLLDGFWEGKFLLVKKDNITFEAKIKLKRLALRDRNLLRISVYEPRKTGTAGPGIPDLQPTNLEKSEQTLLAALEEKYRIEDVLDTLLSHQSEPFFEAAMYADVHIKKGKVEIYARGDAFKTLIPGTSYDYESTISQLVPDKHPEYVILEDTLESTKTIDWALFIPHGIRSYFAKLFFHGNQLRTLLFLGSTESHGFSEAGLDLYEVYCRAFLKGLKNRRHYMKNSKKVAKTPGQEVTKD